MLKLITTASVLALCCTSDVIQAAETSSVPPKNSLIAKHGRRGPRGHRGHRGRSQTNAFISAVTADTSTLNAETLITSFTVQSSKGITYDSTTGVFTSNKGPGYYEVTFGGSWKEGDSSALALYVDGAVYGPTAQLYSQTTNSTSDWASGSIIVRSTAENPTFAIGPVFDPITLFSQVGSATAFVTIKKIHKN